MDDNCLIGKENNLPWHLPADLKYFKKITTGKTVLMGRKTYSSIGKPLPNRRNIVVSRNTTFVAEGCEVVDSISKALELTKNDSEVLVMGGLVILRTNVAYGRYSLYYRDRRGVRW